MTERIVDNTHNINDRITFKVTEKGREILAAKFAAEIEAVPDGRFASEIKGVISEVAERTVQDDGSITMTVWEMAHTFGPHLFNGAPQIIEQNSFTFQQTAD